VSANSYTYLFSIILYFNFFVVIFNFLELKFVMNEVYAYHAQKEHSIKELF